MQKTSLGLSPDFNKETANAFAVVKKELQAAAKAHKVKIKADGIMYASVQKIAIAHAPIAGIEKYKDADFEAGVPIQLLIIDSKTKGEIPNGSYLVKAQYKRRAVSGKAIFTNSAGAVVIQRELIVRTWEQSAVLFPGVYSDPGPQLIPNITSTHVWHNNKWSVDCAGWIPYRVLYY